MCVFYVFILFYFFFFKQKTAYEMRISDWSSDVCSSDLSGPCQARPARRRASERWWAWAGFRGETRGRFAQSSAGPGGRGAQNCQAAIQGTPFRTTRPASPASPVPAGPAAAASGRAGRVHRSEEHTSELQSLMRISYAV